MNRFSLLISSGGARRVERKRSVVWKREREIKSRLIAYPARTHKHPPDTHHRLAARCYTWDSTTSCSPTISGCSARASICTSCWSPLSPRRKSWKSGFICAAGASRGSWSPSTPPCDGLTATPSKPPSEYIIFLFFLYYAGGSHVTVAFLCAAALINSRYGTKLPSASWALCIVACRTSDISRSRTHRFAPAAGEMRARMPLLPSCRVCEHFDHHRTYAFLSRINQGWFLHVIGISRVKVNLKIIGANLHTRYGETCFSAECVLPGCIAGTYYWVGSLVLDQKECTRI